MQILLSIGFALLAGLLMSRVVKPLKLPAVTGYLLAGILVGPYCLGRLGVPGVGFTSMEEVSALNLISEVALGFIAFSIGNEFRLSQLRKTGRQAAVIGVVQALAATLLVDIALYGLHLILGEDKLPLSVVITLGAIATATAPAATLMVVNQYKAKGPLTDLLLPIVALDDAVGLVVFAVSFGVAKAISFGTFSLAAVLFNPLIEVIGSLLLGALMGYIFTLIERFFHSNSKRLSISITFVILTVALSMLEIDLPGTELKLSFSSLLVCMMLGTIFCNICDFSEELMERCDRWTAPLFVLFFVVSGAELDLAGFFRCGRRRDRRRLHPGPFPGQIHRLLRQRQSHALRSQHCKIPGHHAVSPGRRRPGYDHHRGGRIGGTRQNHSQHRPVRRPDL